MTATNASAEIRDSLIPGRLLARQVVLRTAAVVGAAVLVTVVVYVVSGSVSPTYESSATVRVSLPGAASTSSLSVSASNDLASQYAQLASAEPVRVRAERRLRYAEGALSGKISASTVSAQNLIRITAKAGDAADARRRADAAADGLIAYVTKINGDQASRYAQAVSERLKPIDAQIKRVEKRVATGTPDDRRNASLVLANLVAQREQVQSTIAQNAAAGQPYLMKVTPAANGQKTSPRPRLYALVGFVVVVLVGGRIALIGLSRWRRPRPQFPA